MSGGSMHITWSIPTETGEDEFARRDDGQWYRRHWIARTNGGPGRPQAWIKIKGDPVPELHPKAISGTRYVRLPKD